MAKDKFSDKHFMKLALKQAAKGFYTTSPNPAVGCVIVRNGKILGKGYHHQAGQPHAEVMAMRDAQERHEDIRGATVYVTLEPCSHYGRTPPCAKALCDAGVRRVVMATLDPNPKVAGRGKAMLEEAGIEVRVGVCARKAEDLNRAFLYSIIAKRPWVFTKHAISLDGKVALASGESRWITGLEARSDVQRLRLWSDAIITSHETVKADNPRMNVRVRELPEDVRKRLDLDLISSPIKVIIDSHGTLCQDRNTSLLEPYGIFASGENYIVVGTHEPFAAVDPEQEELSLDDRASQVAATSLEDGSGAGAAHKVLVCNKNTPRVSKKLEQPTNKAAVAADTTSSADATTAEAASPATTTPDGAAAAKAQAEKTGKSKAKATSKAASKGKAASKAKAATAAAAQDGAATEAQAAANATTTKAPAHQSKKTQGKGKKGAAAPAVAIADSTSATTTTAMHSVAATAATSGSAGVAGVTKSDVLEDQAQGLRQLSENRKEAALASALAEAERITSAADAAQEAAEAAVERDANSAFGVVSGASSELNVKHSLTAAMTAEALADESDDADTDADADAAAADASAEAMALEFPTKAKAVATTSEDTFATAEESLAAALSASAAQDKAAHKGKKAKGKKELVNADFEQAAAAAVVAAQAEAAAQAAADSDSCTETELTTATKAKGKAKNKAKHHGAKGKVGESMLAATDPLRTFVPKVLLQGKNFRVEAWTEHTSIVYVPMVKDAQGQEHASLEAVLDFLGAKEIRVAMVEAGGKLSSAFMAERLINECYCYVSPMLLGQGAREGFVLPEIAHLNQALRFSKVEVTQLGHDVRLDLRGPIFGEDKGGK